MRGAVSIVILVSGILSGTWKVGVGQECGDCFNQGGPSHHSVQVVRSCAETPLVSISAGFSFVDTCLHCADGTSSWMFWTRLETNVFRELGGLLSQHKTMDESLQAYMVLIWRICEQYFSNCLIILANHFSCLFLLRSYVLLPCRVFLVPLRAISTSNHCTKHHRSLLIYMLAIACPPMWSPCNHYIIDHTYCNGSITD